MRRTINKYQNQKCIIIDESGNMGSSGRYFVIACVETDDYKSLYNIMHKKLGQAKKLFPTLANLHAHEIKAKEAYPCVKYHILECIAAKNLSVSYIVADLQYTKPSLLTEKNIYYNFLLKLLLENLVTSADNGKTVNILCDNKTTKVGSVNSLAEYLKLYFLFEKNYDITLNIEYMDSDDNNAYPIQAADYVANALYAQYEYGTTLFSSVINSKIKIACKFPLKNFGK